MTQNHENNPQNNNKFLEPEIDSELAEILSRIIHKNPKEIIKYLHLFNNIDVLTRNIFYSLSKMNEKQKLNAHLSLEYLLHCNENIVDLMAK